MTKLCCDVLQVLKGKTLSTAESCTGGGIGAALTSIPGSSEVYRGGIISYTNEIKHQMLGVDNDLLNREGAVCALVAESMAVGVRKTMQTDVAVSVTGLAGPSGDSCGNPVGTVFIGYSDPCITYSRKFFFEGDRESIRNQTIYHALMIVYEQNKHF